MTPADHKKVGGLMEAYFEGLHQADSTMRGFRPR